MKKSKIFLEKIPTLKESGKPGKGKNWDKSIGMDIEFIYRNLNGSFKIVKYDKGKQMLYVIYNNKETPIATSQVLSCSLGGLLGVVDGKFKIEIGSKFEDAKRSLFITDREYRYNKRKNGMEERYKWYKYTCNNCGWNEGWVVEGALLNQGVGCSCCANATIVKGINDLATKRPDLVKYFKNPNEAYELSEFTHKKVDLICPDCKTERSMNVSKLSGRGFNCGFCSDGISIPEKFLMFILNKFKANYVKEYSPKWCGKMRYDFYLKDFNTIIEVHGEQHYAEKSQFAMSLEEVQKNDEYKINLALENNINNYIVIDCRESDIDWLSRNMLNSKLNDLFDLKLIDFNEAFEFAISTSAKLSTRDMWNNRDIGVKRSVIVSNIAEKLGVSPDSVRNYLKDWSKVGQCDYASTKRSGRNNGKKIEVYKDDIFIGVFDYIKDISANSEKLYGVKLSSSKISRAISMGIQHKGYTFKYV